MATYVHAPGVHNIYQWCRNCSKYPGNPESHFCSSRGKALRRVSREREERQLPVVS
jgi:rRNA maturation endonuclease Nob1